MISEFDNPLVIVGLLSLSNISIAGMDLIVEALMVMQAKRDPTCGAQELQSFSWFIRSLSSVLFGILCAYLTSYYSPHWTFAL